MPPNPFLDDKGPREKPIPKSNPPYTDGIDYVCPAYEEYFKISTYGSKGADEQLNA
jgi:hypothetical protein